MMNLRVEYHDLENHGFDAGGSEILYYKGVLFTGIAEFTTKGVLCEEEEYQNGYLEGVRKTYYPGGQIESELTLKNNSFHGTFTRWDDNGNIITLSNWQNGVQV